MAVKFRKVIRKVIGGEHKGEERMYAVAKANYACDLTRICELVTARTALSSADVKATIDALLWVSNLELKNGATLRLADFGSFRTVLRSEGINPTEKFQTNHIRGARVIFNPGPQLRKTMADLYYEAEVPYEVTEECARPHAG